MRTYSIRRSESEYTKNKKKFRESPRGRYMDQKSKAWARRIAWRFTFDTWYGMWLKSGKWSKRGRGPGKYCMARFGDKGPYSPENCFIAPHQKNFLWGHSIETVRARHAKSYDQYAFE